MADLIYDEVQLFGVCLLLGVELALIYDGIRVLRLLFQHWDWLVDVEDLLYWMYTAWLVFRTLFHYNQGMLRGYAFLGMFLGVILYLGTLSRLLLHGVRRVVPHWNKCKSYMKRPFMKVADKFRKALKTIATEVTMAIKGR